MIDINAYFSVIKRCDICGRALPEGQRKHNYCSYECAEKAKQIKAHDAYMREKQESYDLFNNICKNNNKKKKYTGPSIAEISAAAKKENLSYGQYIAKYRI